MCKKCGVFAVHSTCRLEGDAPGSTAPTAHTRPTAWGCPCPYTPHAPRCHRCTQPCHVSSVGRQAGSPRAGWGGHGRLQAWTEELCWGYTRPCPALGHGAGAVSPRHPSLGPSGPQGHLLRPHVILSGTRPPAPALITTSRIWAGCALCSVGAHRRAWARAGLRAPPALCCTPPHARLVSRAVQGPFCGTVG